MRLISKILIFTLLLSFVKNAISGNSNSNNYVRNACSVTRYQDLCIHSLASFSRAAKTNPSIWARAGVSVTIGEAKNVTQYLNKLKKYKAITGRRNRIALMDCIECFEDSVDNLHRSLGVLRNLDASKFDVQMGDVTTWLSAALTDADTCSDGFQFGDYQDFYISKQVRVIRIKVLRATYITSNALALVNKLASTGLGNSVH